MAKLMLLSYGLTTKVGRELIYKELKKEKSLEDKRITLFYEPYYSITDLLMDVCVNMGFQRENIYLINNPKSEDNAKNILESDYIYVTEGNTFEILSLLREYDIIEPIRKAVANGTTYIGASAGAMIAGVSIKEAENFDRNFLLMKNMEGLCLFDGIILPHYEPAERMRYIANSPGILETYNTILSVSNDSIVLLEV